MFMYAFVQHIVGDIGEIIPPSLVLIAMADQLGRSVGDMYQGAFIPGLMLGGLYAVYVFGVTVLRPRSAPALPPDALNLREADGGAGYLSLLVVVALTVAAAYGLTWTCTRSGRPVWPGSALIWRRWRTISSICAC